MNSTRRRRRARLPTQRWEGGLSGPRDPASPAQRAKVAAEPCVVCGRVPVDPAHLVPQRLGGCPHRDCVIALCRTHHRLFDRARLSLAPYLGDGFRQELTHALTHVEADELQRAMESGGWPPPWIRKENEED